MGRRTVLLATCAAVLGSATGGAQTPRVIRGVVVDSVRQPLTGVVVAIDGTQTRAVSTERGRFSLYHQAPDTARVRVMAIGYHIARYRLDTLEALVNEGKEIVLAVAPPKFEGPALPKHPPNILDDTIADSRVS